MESFSRRVHSFADSQFYTGSRFPSSLKDAPEIPENSRIFRLYLIFEACRRRSSSRQVRENVSYRSPTLTLRSEPHCSSRRKMRLGLPTCFPSCLGGTYSSRDSLTDEFTLKLRECGKYVQEEPSHRLLSSVSMF